jgi:hypothetical protein
MVFAKVGVSNQCYGEVGPDSRKRDGRVSPNHRECDGSIQSPG